MKSDPGVDRDTNVCSNPPGTPCPKPPTPHSAASFLPGAETEPDQGEQGSAQGATGGPHGPSTGRSVSPSRAADLERTVLALAANAEDYWTTQEIADFVGRSRRQVYRILAKLRAGRR